MKRGTTLPDDVLARYQVGAIVPEHGYFSTSITRPFGGPHRFVVHSARGRHIRQLSAHEIEDEVLFPSGTPFRVLDRIDGADMVPITMEEVND